MAKKKLGNKHVCYQCGCKFYDLRKPRPICPKCGADQNEAPKKAQPAPQRSGGSAAAAPRSRPRKRRVNEESLDPALPLSETETDTPVPLEDGLTLIDDEDLIGPAGKTPSEEG